MVRPRSPSTAGRSGAEELGDRFTGPDGELIHAEVQIGDSVVMITEDAVDGPVRSPDHLGGMVSCVMSLYWENVHTAWERAVGAGRRGDLPACRATDARWSHGTVKLRRPANGYLSVMRSPPMSAIISSLPPSART